MYFQVDVVRLARWLPADGAGTMNVSASAAATPDNCADDDRRPATDQWAVHATNLISCHRCLPAARLFVDL